MLKILGALVGTVILLVVELITTVLVYTSLNIYNFELFGKLVRFAGEVLETMSTFVSNVFAGATADSAYASLFGELGPKSMLLLLIGLVVAAIFRLLITAIRAMFAG